MLGSGTQPSSRQKQRHLQKRIAWAGLVRRPTCAVVDRLGALQRLELEEVLCLVLAQDVELPRGVHQVGRECRWAGERCA